VDREKGYLKREQNSVLRCAYFGGGRVVSKRGGGRGTEVGKGEKEGGKGERRKGGKGERGGGRRSNGQPWRGILLSGWHYKFQYIPPSLLPPN
jgi:hypothetical protein